MLIESNIILESKVTFRALRMMVPVVAGKLRFTFESLFAPMTPLVEGRTHVVLVP